MASVLTTNLSPAILDYIRRESKQKKTTQRSIIEEGIRAYRKEQLKQQVKEAFALHWEADRAIVAEWREISMRSLKF